MIDKADEISCDRVHMILHEHLKIRKLNMLGVPDLLTDDHKHARLDTNRMFHLVPTSFAIYLIYKKILFNYDNALVYTSVVERQLGLIPQPAVYFPNLVPSDHLFPNLKKQFIGKKFFTNTTAVENNVTRIFSSLDKLYFFDDIKSKKKNV